MKVSKVEFDNSDLEEQQPVMAVKSELVFLDHFNRIINERDDDIDIGQLGYENYQALKLAALDAFRATMIHGADENSSVITDGWVACSERMPEIGQKVFYYFDIVGVHAGYYDGDNTFVKENGGGWLTGDVTHWMEWTLPAAPKREVK